MPGPEPDNLHAKVAGAQSGSADYSWVFNSFLTYYDFAGVPHPMIAREIPTRENGGWAINADGTMVTTYRLRENARWHDGAPLTARDFVFGYQVAVDPEMPIRDRLPETLVSSVEAADDHTLVISWKQPYVTANLLSYLQMEPLPQHVLAEKYRTNKANFVFGEEWTTSYVGSGPYRLERWSPGAGLIARANVDWFLGSPKLDTLDIRFIPDPRTQLANLLSGEVDMINSPAIRAPEAVVARDQWVATGQGYIKTWQKTIRYLEFQFREVPNHQRAVTDVRVRQALTHAADLQGLAEALTHGFGTPAHVFVVPSDPDFAEVDRAAVKYPFDTNRALALLAEAGWTQRQPGAALTDAAGQPLELEIWSTTDGGGEQESAILADNWRAVGIRAGINMIPAARQRDNEFRVSFPAVNGTARSATRDNFVWVSAHVPTAEARWQGPNRGSFRDGEIERLHNLALTSFAEGDRRGATVALHKRMSEVVGIRPLYYQVNVLLAKHKVRGPLGEVPASSGITWNVFEWEMTE